MEKNNKISFWRTLLRAIRYGISSHRLARYRNKFAIDDSEESRMARVAYDYIVFRHTNSKFNQFVLTLTLVFVIALVPALPLVVVWLLFQMSELACYWMTGRAEIEIKLDQFNAKFWNKFKYIFNITQFVLTALAFIVFSTYAHPETILATAISFLMVVILSSSLNFFSIRFNVLNLAWQMLGFLGFTAFFISSRNMTTNFPEDLYQTVPVLLTILSSHVGVWSYHRYYVSSLDNERESYLAQQKLIENTRILAREKRLVDRIQSTIGEAIIVIDGDGAIKRSNPAFRLMFDIGAGAIHEMLSEYIDASLLISDGTKRNFMSKSKDQHFIIQGFPLSIQDEDELKLFAVIDVSEKVKSDQLATQSQKLNALGVLTGGIAHDFNNILAVIKANADLIEQSDDIDKIKDDYLGDILMSCDSATGLTRQILSFVRDVPLKNAVVNPKDIIDQTIKMVHNSLEPSYNVEIETLETGSVYCDVNLLKNALINLILNARDAMPNVGNIRVRVFPEGTCVVFSVEDQGAGIPEEHMEKVVEPFFTLKPNEKGTGIGLSIVKQFAERSSGLLRLKSKLGKGTQAQILLPVFGNSNALPSDQKFQSIELTKPEKQLNILVVDDNVMLAKSLKRQIEIMGHFSKVAHSLDEFKVVTMANQFDVVICDIVLKAETGLEIWNYAQKIGLKSKFIYISGNISPELRGDLQKQGSYRLLEKPIDFKDLRSEVNQSIA